jgi:hypothetical protein
MAVAGHEIKPCGRLSITNLWMNGQNGLRLGHVRRLALLVVVAGWTGCRVLTSGLSGEVGAPDSRDVASAVDAFPASADAQPAIDVGEPPGVPGAPDIVGCSDGTREGFRDVGNWPDIAGCAGAFDQPGVAPDMRPLCDRLAGDSNSNHAGKDCTAADLCADNWHVCRSSNDVAKHSPTGDCESCVPAGEARFFLMASGATSMGVCSPDPQAVNDLHGCGSLGQPEAQTCSPLSRRMGFADCLATNGVWNCGGPDDNLREASLVTKSGANLGGVLCCKDY